MDRVTFTIEPKAPYDLGLTAPEQPFFRGDGAEGLNPSDDGYRRLLDLGDKAALAVVRPTGRVDEPMLEVELRGGGLTEGDAAAAAEQLEWVLGSGQDVRPFYDGTRDDAVMQEITGRFYGMHLTHSLTVFESLVLAILGQQIAAPVARVVRRLVVETYGNSETFDGVEYFAFPRPEAIHDAPVEELRGLKLSQRKAEYVRGIAAAAMDSSGWLEGLKALPEDEAVERLTELRGVGKWSAHWVLTRALGHPDAFPSGDLALQRAVSNLYFGGEKQGEREVEEFSERWRPFRAYANGYLFAALRAGLA